MKVNYKTILFGEEALEEHAVPKTADDIYVKELIDFQDACCDPMAELMKMARPFISKEGTGLVGSSVFRNTFFNSPDPLVRFCPFCGTKIEVVQKERYTRVKTETRTVNYYEERPII